jgi:hypothetical protein
MLDEIRAVLEAKFGITSAEFTSLAGLVQSQLQVSLVRLLREGGSD